MPLVSPTPPAWTPSRYMSTVDPAVLYSLGHRLGQNDLASGQIRDGIVILDFGKPYYQRKTKTYGTTLFGGIFASVSQIADAVKQYSKGYYDGVGTNLSHLRVAAGTNNKGRYTAFDHGRAWAQMVDEVNLWIQAGGYVSRVDAAGASDMELSWNTPRVTRDWVEGYKSFFTSTAVAWTLYNYGDAAGCPPYGNCNNGWTQEDVWYVSWGSGISEPFPEIYTTNGSQAKEWYNLSLYSYLNHGARMNIAGTLTQYQACLDVGGCSGTNNTPEQGWLQLWNALNADPRTAQDLRWSTDITWKNV